MTIAEIVAKPLEANSGDLAARYRSVLMGLHNIEPVVLDADTGAMAGAFAGAGCASGSKALTLLVTE